MPDMVTDQDITDARLRDWRKLGQGLHARFLTDDFAAGVRFLAAVGSLGDVVGHHLQVRLHSDFVELKLISDDAVYRDDRGVEHQVEWVTRSDLELAPRISAVAADQGLEADPASLTAVELALDTAHPSTLAPVWSALLTGGPEAQGRGTIDEDVRDPTGRVPILWFQATEEHETPRQRFHLDIQVPYDVAEHRIATAVAAGAVVVDDSRAPSTIVLADPDGNKACIGTFAPAE